MDSGLGEGRSCSCVLETIVNRPRPMDVDGAIPSTSAAVERASSDVEIIGFFGRDSEPISSQQYRDNMSFVERRSVERVVQPGGVSQQASPSSSGDEENKELLRLRLQRSREWALEAANRAVEAANAGEVLEINAEVNFIEDVVDLQAYPRSVNFAHLGSLQEHLPGIVIPRIADRVVRAPPERARSPLRAAPRQDRHRSPRPAPARGPAELAERVEHADRALRAERVQRPAVLPELEPVGPRRRRCPRAAPWMTSVALDSANWQLFLQDFGRRYAARLIPEPIRRRR